MAQTLPLPKAMGCTQAPGQGLASGLSQNPLSKLLAVSLGCGAWANPCVSAKALTTVFTKAWAEALATSTVAKALAKGFSMSLELPSDKAIGYYFSVIGRCSMEAKTQYIFLNHTRARHAFMTVKEAQFESSQE